MIDAGLSENVALAALTTNAADQLGISKINLTSKKNLLSDMYS